MRVAVQDLRRVIRAAGKGGRTVVLGGHSLGGTITTAYATWDFRGGPGARDLAGLVFIDGGSSAAPVDAAAARAQRDAIATASPFNDLVGLGVPWAAGVFAAIGSTLALKAPDERSAFREFPFAPAALKAPVAVTNAAQFGYAIDTETGPASLALVHAHLGGLAPAGDPRGWRDGELASVERTARAVSGIAGVDGFAWYHPRRLSLDAAAVAGGVGNPAQDVLGLRATRGRAARLPIYAFETSLGQGRVLTAARALAKRAGLPARKLTLVDRSASNAHCDPIFDDAKRNAFLRTVVPFLDGV
jgi:pimeloyl-ACP methyl ester carboxylesterase